jgi:hypothetical protein
VGHGAKSRNAAVATLDDEAAVRLALDRLRTAGIDMRAVSVLARDRRPAHTPAAYYATEGHARVSGEGSGFWNQLWQLLPGWAVVTIPGWGTLLAAGALGGWLVNALENSGVFGELTAVEAALYSLGLEKEEAGRCEEAVASGRILLIAHGPAEEVERIGRALAMPDSLENR